MLRNMSSATKASIVSGVVASVVFLYFVDPILGFLARIFLRSLQLVHSAYLDRLYAEIAVADPDFSYEFQSLLTLMVLAWILGFLVGRAKEKRSPGGYSGALVSRFLLVAGVALILLLPINVVDGYVRLKTATTFRQHVTILAPLLSDQEVKEIRAQYASMRSKKDYDVLVQRLSEIALAHKIVLPRNKLYPI